MPDLAGYRVRRLRGGVRRSRRPSCGGWRSTSAGWCRPTTGACTCSPRRRSAGWRCSSASARPWVRPGRWTVLDAVRRQLRTARRDAGRGDLRRRARRRPAPHLRRPRSRASSSPEPSSPGSASRCSTSVPFSDVYSIGADWVPLITVIWLLLMANAVNLIDGLDGLAAGIVAIASGTFFLYSQQLNDAGRLEAPNIGPLLAVITLGMCVGFLPHNFNPARIFMGDGGSPLLGLMMAASTSVVGGGPIPTRGSAARPTSSWPRWSSPPHPRRADPRLPLRRDPARRRPLGPHRGRQEPPAPPAHAFGHGQRRSVLILWLQDAAVRSRAVPHLHRRGRRLRSARGGCAGAHPLHRAAPRGPPEPGGRRG